MKSALAKRRAVPSARDQRVRAQVDAAEVFFQAQAYDKCIAICLEGLSLAPSHLTFHELLALSHLQANRPEQARQAYLDLLEHHPGNFLAELNLAKICLNTEAPQAALPYLQSCKAKGQMQEEVEYLLGLCHEAMEEWPQAIDQFSRVLETNHLNPQAYVKLAHCMGKIKHLPEGLELIEAAQRLMPQSRELWLGKALILRDHGFHAGALTAYESLQKIQPETPDFIGLHAEQLFTMKRERDAIQRYQDALRIDPHHIYSLSGIGIAHLQLKEFDQAESYFLKILELDPAHQATLINLSTLAMTQRNLLQSWKYSEQLFELNKNFAAQYLYQMCFQCDWTRYAEARQALAEDPAFERANAFQPVIFTDDAAAHLGYARKNARQFKSSGILGPLTRRERGEKIKIGYYSCDYFAHATTMLMEALFNAHDRSRFEIHAFSLDLRPNDAYNQRMRELFDHFHDVHHISDRAVAHLSRELGIDIAIDLKGYTEGSRTGIFAERAAPIQINYLGFPGSMGADFIDFIIADHQLITPETRAFYSEHVIYMPDCYQPNNPDRPRPVAESPRPAELPDGPFVYASFNNAYKITPAMFEVWMDILAATPQSVLWLLSPPPEGKKNLHASVARRGIDPNRVIFAPYLPEAEHLNRLQHADLFLDSFPCNAHTSASDALWAGVPLITIQGQSFASRVAASLLHCVGLSDGVFSDESAYRAQAIDLYQHPEKLRDWRARVRAGVQSGKLYDVRDYVRHYEQALIQVHEMHLSNTPFHDIDLPTVSV